MDSASRIGCKSQSYTSWDCVSRSYVGAVCIFSIGDQGTAPPPPPPEEMKWDYPTAAELAQLSTVDKKLLQKGANKYVRGKGALPLKQATEAMMRRRERQAASIPARVSGSEASQKPVHLLDQAAGGLPLTLPPINKPPTDQQAVSHERPPAGTSGAPHTVAEQRSEYDAAYYYSDLVPVKCMAISSMVCPRETDPMPYSPQYQVLAGRLNDPAQTGVLSSVVRGPNVKDATTMTSLVKALTLRSSTRYEMAALVRSCAMSLSLALESYQSDPIPHRFVRKPKSLAEGRMLIHPKPASPRFDWVAVAAPLDAFVALANNSYSDANPIGFHYSSLDSEWVAVPVLLRKKKIPRNVMRCLCVEGFHVFGNFASSFVTIRNL
ncbi:hypothetical protein PUN28_017975 [Cardiocondyla obscurior]|uniref:Uncharacterized protein n=1 Tax=Cardiocondyla obscurior TaxID=286306 RepID=A0AAW2EHZ8_9HYME